VATENNNKLWEYSRAQFFNFDAVGGYYGLNLGYPEELIVEVKQASAHTGTAFSLTLFLITADTFTSTKQLILKVDCTVSGKRVVTPMGASGIQNTDSLTLDSVPATAIPANRISFASPYWALSGLSVPAAIPDSPIVEVTVRSDAGLYGKRLVYAQDGAGAPISYVVGNLP